MQHLHQKSTIISWYMFSIQYDYFKRCDRSVFSGIKNVQGILLNEKIVTEKYITSMIKNIYTLKYVLNVNISNCDKTFWSDSYKTLGTSPPPKKKKSTTINVWFISRFLVLFHWSIGLSLYIIQYTVNYCSFVVSFENLKSSQNLFKDRFGYSDPLAHFVWFQST